jgi:hypothetical protein
MANFSWVAVCQRALIDQIGNISLIQLVEELGFAKPPADQPQIPHGAAIPFPFAIVSHWTRAKRDVPERQFARMRLLSPKKKEFASAMFDVDLIQHERARCIAELPGIIYFGPGSYFVSVETLKGKKWRKVGEASISVHHNVNVPAPAPAPLAISKARKAPRKSSPAALK